MVIGNFFINMFDEVNSLNEDMLKHVTYRNENEVVEESEM